MQTQTGLRPCCTSGRPVTARAHFLGGRPFVKSGVAPVIAQRCRRQSGCRAHSSEHHHKSPEYQAAASISGSFALWLISELSSSSRADRLFQRRVCKGELLRHTGSISAVLARCAVKLCPVKLQVQSIAVTNNQLYHILMSRVLARRCCVCCPHSNDTRSIRPAFYLKTARLLQGSGHR